MFFGFVTLKLTMISPKYLCSSGFSVTLLDYTFNICDTNLDYVKSIFVSQYDYGLLTCVAGMSYEQGLFLGSK